MPCEQACEVKPQELHSDVKPCCQPSRRWQWPSTTGVLVNWQQKSRGLVPIIQLRHCHEAQAALRKKRNLPQLHL